MNNSSGIGRDEKIPQLKILLLGNSGVGKTSIITSFTEQKFNVNVISTVGVDFRQKRMHDIDGKTVDLRVWDTAGQDLFRSITRQYYRGAMGILLVYDVCSIHSFQHLTYWIRNIAQYASPHVAKIIVANKVDNISARQVPTEVGIQFATSLNLPYFECSALDYESIKPIFIHMCRIIMSNISTIAPGLIEQRPTPGNSVDIAQTDDEEGNEASKCAC